MTSNLHTVSTPSKESVQSAGKVCVEVLALPSNRVSLALLQLPYNAFSTWQPEQLFPSINLTAIENAWST